MFDCYQTDVHVLFTADLPAVDGNCIMSALEGLSADCIQRHVEVASLVALQFQHLDAIDVDVDVVVVINPPLGIGQYSDVVDGYSISQPDVRRIPLLSRNL